jgi:protocatechuate 3,4-dioxygenase beta subunit
MTDHDKDTDHAPDGGLRMDVTRIMGRRAALGILAIAGGAGAYVALRGVPGMAQTTLTATAADGSTCVGAASETAGPFPGDGTNSRDGSVVNVLAEAGVERSDIRPSFAGFDGVAEGIPMTVEIRLVNVNAACAPLAGYHLYLWHCDANGDYSLYSITDVNYLRGLQVADANGLVRFTTILPGCYDGRWPHLHFEVFADAAAAQSGDTALLTSQFALPGDLLKTAYAADPRYATSVANLSGVSLERDGIFRDNSAEQMTAMMLTIVSDATAGFTATVTVGIAA